MSKSKQPPTLLAAVFVICGVGILILNIINYFQDGRIGTFSIFGFMIILLGLWFYFLGKKSNREDHKE